MTKTSPEFIKVRLSDEEREFILAYRDSSPERQAAIEKLLGVLEELDRVSQPQQTRKARRPRLRATTSRSRRRAKGGAR
jgi:hypothetical protein